MTAVADCRACRHKHLSGPLTALAVVNAFCLHHRGQWYQRYGNRTAPPPFPPPVVLVRPQACARCGGRLLAEQDSTSVDMSLDWACISCGWRWYATPPLPLVAERSSIANPRHGPRTGGKQL